MTKVRTKIEAGAMAYWLLEMAKRLDRKITCERVRDRAPMERKYIDIVKVHMSVNR